MKQATMRLACVVTGLVLAAACGTRVERQSVSSRPTTATGAPVAGGEGAPLEGSGAATVPAAAEGTATPATGGSPSALGTTTTTGTRTADPGAPTGGGSGAPTRAANEPGTRESPAPQGGTGAQTLPTAPPSPGGTPPPGGAPALVASVGTYSGPAASTLKPILEGAQLWTRFINQRGGLNGHEVRLLVYDDAGDPSRHRAQVQEAVEQKKVIAFVANAEALTGTASNDYIASHRVPVIGVDGGLDFPYSNPMYFLQHPTGNSHFLGFALATAQQLVPTGRTKLATLLCQEAQACSDMDRIYRERAKSLGLELVYQGRASIAQPDFTAECLAARNAGAESFFILMDGNSVTRVATACARQGYEPQYALAAEVILDRFKDDPNLEGVVGSSSVYPWFGGGTPAADEFQAALKAFGAKLQPGVGMVTGWTAGKLLERAGRNLPEPPTSEALLEELWTIRGDDLGGLTYPITFVEGRPSERKTCWFNLAVRGGKWLNPDGYKLHCGQ